MRRLQHRKYYMESSLKIPIAGNSKGTKGAGMNSIDHSNCPVQMQYLLALLLSGCQLLDMRSQEREWQEVSPIW